VQGSERFLLPVPQPQPKERYDFSFSSRCSSGDDACSSIADRELSRPRNVPSRTESKRIGSDAHPGSPLFIHLLSDLHQLLFRSRLDDRIEFQTIPVVLLDRILCSDLGSSRLTHTIQGRDGERGMKSNQPSIRASRIYKLNLIFDVTYQVDLDQIHARASVLDKEHL
jgi:hypothetical protein